MDAIKVNPFHAISGRLAGWTYLWLGILATIVLATMIAWLHQAIVRRMTFALFRVYATIVCAGIGSVFGWLLAFWLQAHGAWWPASVAQMSLLLYAFGCLGFRGARRLRGHAPHGLSWVTPEEFRGI